MDAVIVYKRVAHKKSSQEKGLVNDQAFYIVQLILNISLDKSQLITNP
ncbi:hypothetical protein O9993_13460 [Vibrio lentus]|nr:hypothetical protein [Vibrio lentus]